MKLRNSSSLKGLITALVILLLVNLAFLGLNMRPFLEEKGYALPFIPELPGTAKTATDTPAPTSSPTPENPTNTPAPITLVDTGSPIQNIRREGVMILSIRDGMNAHLFAYHPLYLPLSRLTNQSWDDITPALNPDGSQLAFSSRRNGYWDIYILNLVSGKLDRLTDTPEYEASPTWSPDGQWIAYEKYNGKSLDIYLQSLTDLDAGPIQLTEDPGIDRSPAWSPQGREIAFVSTRSGDEEIWLGRLDKIDDRFINLSQSSETQERNPAWSLDGNQLNWASERDGVRQVMVWNKNQTDLPAQMIGEGDRAAWSPDSKVLFTEVRDSQSNSLTGYERETGRLSMPLNPLPGQLYGMVWVQGPMYGWLADQLEYPDQSSPEPIWKPLLTRTIAPAGRMGLITLENVTAPQPLLHDAVDEAFYAFREQIAIEAGWDALSSLENAYVALTTPPTPSIQNDWLYTGRAFALNPLLTSAGWVVISKEEFSGQVFWRTYLKARYQDGSMGAPLTDMVWDIQARYNGNPATFEAGGAPGNPPTGYWIDLTEISTRYGWSRMPSWMNWRSFYPSIRYNQFVMTGGLDWNQAMAEIYPPEALKTPTSIPTITPTASRTPKATSIPVTNTPSTTPTSIPTLHPTWTPNPP